MYKFNKESLLEESQNVGFEDVGFDSLFESLGIEDEEAKTRLQEAFELASRNGAVQLTEAHLNKMAEYSQSQVDELVAIAQSDFEGKLSESIDNLLVSVSKEWLVENKLAVENTVKAKQFDSLMTDLKESFIAHNFAIPEDKIDLYEELAMSERETTEMADKIFKENVELKQELNTIKRDKLIESLSEGMVETQRERFVDLAKAIKLDESLEDRLTVLSESISLGINLKSKVSKEEQLVEDLKAGASKETQKAESEPLVEGAKEGKISTRELTEDEKLLRMFF